MSPLCVNKVGYSPLISLATALYLLSQPLSGSSPAQPIPDNTLFVGERSQVIGIPNTPEILIEGGAIRGSNLFHSFKAFNIANGTSVHFSPSPDIDTIIARVTGTNLSRIEGTLGVRGNADLFLMNPNGILFDSEATLDVNGSFIATTASRIMFDNITFRADRPNQPPLLMVNIPTGLQFGTTPGTITNRSIAFEPVDEEGNSIRTGLFGHPSDTLALVGGDLELWDSTTAISGGNIEWGSVGPNSTVALVPIDAGWTLDYENTAAFQTISLNGAALELNLFDNSEELSTAQIRGNIITLDRSNIGGTNNVLNGTGRLVLKAESLIALNNNSAVVQSAFNGNANTIMIETPQLRVADGSGISTTSLGRGVGGTINIKADSIIIEGVQPEEGSLEDSPSRINTRATFQGNAGDLNIEADTLVLRNRGQLNSELSFMPSTNEPVTNGAGNINVDASLIFLDDRAQITAATTGGQGNINLQVQTLLLNNNSSITTSAVDAASAGAIEINTDTFTVLNNSLVDSTAQAGDGGTIRITTNGFVLSPDSRLDVSSQSGTDGTIELLTPNGEPLDDITGDEEEPLDISQLVRTNSCTARGGESSFYLVGKGGLPESPLQTLWPELFWEDWETVTAMMEIFEADHIELHQAEGNPTAAEQVGSDQVRSDQVATERVAADLGETVLINLRSVSRPTSTWPIETQGWLKTDDNRIVLLSHPAPQTPQGSWMRPYDCQLLQEGFDLHRS